MAIQQTTINKTASIYQFKHNSINKMNQDMRNDYANTSKYHASIAAEAMRAEK